MLQTKKRRGGSFRPLPGWARVKNYCGVYIVGLVYWDENDNLGKKSCMG